MPWATCSHVKQKVPCFAASSQGGRLQDCCTSSQTIVSMSRCTQDPDICCSAVQSLVADESFQHILRVLNTNVDGKQKIMFAMTAIRGIGRRFSNLACKKAEVDMRKRYAI